MPKRMILLVDSDPRSLRVLEVSLRKAGYSLTSCADAKSAVNVFKEEPPDLVISETRLPEHDGFWLAQTIRNNPEWSSTPFMFLSGDTSVESKVRGLEQGVEDYLTKPIYIKEILARIQVALQRNDRETVAGRRSGPPKTRFAGNLTDMGLVDLLQTVEVSRKSGLLTLRSQASSALGQQGQIAFRDGQLISAESGALRDERAIYRLLLWTTGEFEINFKSIEGDPSIRVPTHAVLMEGIRRLDEWSRLTENMPPLDSVIDVDDELLTKLLPDLSDESNVLLRSVDGQRSLLEVVDATARDDLDVLEMLQGQLSSGLLRSVGVKRRVSPSDESPLLTSQEMMVSVVPSDLRTDPPAKTALETAGEEHFSKPPAPAAREAASTLTEPVLRENRPMTKDDRQNVAAEPSHTEIKDESEEQMGKKRKKGRQERRMVQEEPLSGSAALSEETNIIQFPAQAKRAMGSIAIGAPSHIESDSDDHVSGSRSHSGPAESRHGEMAESKRKKATDHREAEKIESQNVEQRAERVRDGDVTTDSFEDAPGAEGKFFSDPPPSADDFSDLTDHSGHQKKPWSVWQKAAVGITVTGVAILGFVSWYNQGGVIPQPQPLGSNGPPVLPNLASLPTPSIAPSAEPEAPAPTPAAQGQVAQVAPEQVAPEQVAPEQVAPEQVAPAAAANDPASALGYDAIMAQVPRARGAARTRLLEEAIAANPNGAAALAELAFEAINRRQNARATELANRAVAADPSTALGWLVLGAAREAARDRAGAREAYTQCVTLGQGRWVRECRAMVPR